ncbi:MAG: glycosyltransferase family 1 protein [Candidatus Dormiibacterota bacterium]
MALDGRTLQGAVGGVGRGVANILPFLVAEADLQVLLDARLSPRLNADIPAEAETRLLRAALPTGAAWLQLAVPAALRGFDGVFHCPFYGLPYRQPVPMVVTIHDLTFEHHPEWLPAAKRMVFRAQARHAARTARRILTVSNHVRDDIIATYEVPADRVVAVPPSVDPVFSVAADADALRERLRAVGLTRPYVVAFGGAPRRNLDVALEAMRIARRQGLEQDLVVVGPEALSADPWARGIGALDDGALAAVLAGADVLCYPTSYEGFGMPAAEAVACGTGVVCAPVGCLPELLGDAAEWSEDVSPGAVAAALVRAIGTDAGRRLKEAAGRAASRLPTWQRVAEAHLEAYAFALHYAGAR